MKWRIRNYTTHKENVWYSEDVLLKIQKLVKTLSFTVPLLKDETGENTRILKEILKIINNELER